MANYMGQRVDTSHSNGMRIKEYWVALFQNNERYWHRRDLSRVLSDAQISLAMHGAFPTRCSVLFDRVQRARSRYNSGALGVSPVFRSHPYVREGREIRQCTSRGRVLLSRSLEE